MNCSKIYFLDYCDWEIFIQTYFHGLFTAIPLVLQMMWISRSPLIYLIILCSIWTQIMRAKEIIDLFHLSSKFCQRIYGPIFARHTIHGEALVHVRIVLDTPIVFLVLDCISLSSFKHLIKDWELELPTSSLQTHIWIYIKRWPASLTCLTFGLGTYDGIRLPPPWRLYFPHLTTVLSKKHIASI